MKELPFGVQFDVCCNVAAAVAAAGKIDGNLTPSSFQRDSYF